MSDFFRVEKVVGVLPTVLSPNTIYFLSNNGSLVLYMSDRKGTSALGIHDVDISNKADLINGKIPASQLPVQLTGGLNLKGIVDLSGPTNTLTTFVSSVKGDYYVVIAAGYGYDIGDSAFYNGVSWERIPKAPNNVTPATLGLGNVDNTSDLAKTQSGPIRQALNAKADLVNGTVPTSQLPVIDAAYVGLSKVANTTDLEKTKNGAIKDALDKKADLINGVVPTSQLPPMDLAPIEATLLTKADLVNGVLPTSQLPVIDKVYVGLDLVDNTPDASKPISTPQRSALDLKADLDNGVLKATQLPLLTASQVGLAKVTNSSDQEKVDIGPIHDALSNKANLINGRLDIAETPFVVLGGIHLAGTFQDFATLPAPASANLGYYYICTRENNGYVINDWAISDGVIWERVPNGVVTSLLSKVALSGEYTDILHRPTFTKSMVVSGPIKPFVGTAKWSPDRTLRVSGIYLTIGTLSTNDMIVDVKINGLSATDNQNIRLPANAYKSPVYPISFQIGDTDFITADVISATDGSDLSITLIYQ